MKWRSIAVGALLLAPAAVTAGHAQTESPRRPGLFREIRRRLIPPDAAEAWREARQIPSALEALPLMENLAKRGAAESPAAALWLGHFYYGAGDATTARPWFARAAEEAQDEGARSEARFWEMQCGLVAVHVEGAPAPAAGRGGGDLRERFVRSDALFRAGDAAAAWDLGLEEESGARQEGLLSPLVFRLTRAASAGGSEVDRLLDRLPAWYAATGPSPERALVRAMSAGLRRTPESPPASPTPPPGGASPFVEPVDSTAVAAASAPEGVSAASPVPVAAAVGERFEVQLGSFADAERADHEVERLNGLGLPAVVRKEETGGATWYKIRWGSFRSRDEAEESAQARCTGLSWTIVRSTSSEP